jgi:hypothetical protein|tara:strand:+ start:10 stop:228 length:219 start_codon:yes stop_codon:yes gene_type:complete
MIIRQKRFIQPVGKDAITTYDGKSYPSNPYMCLFLSLAYVLKGDLAKVEELRAQARDINSTNSVTPENAGGY